MNCSYRGKLKPLQTEQELLDRSVVQIWRIPKAKHLTHVSLLSPRECSSTHSWKQSFLNGKRKMPLLPSLLWLCQLWGTKSAFTDADLGSFLLPCCTFQLCPDCYHFLGKQKAPSFMGLFFLSRSGRLIWRTVWVFCCCQCFLASWTQFFFFNNLSEEKNLIEREDRWALTCVSFQTLWTWTLLCFPLQYL